MSAKGVPKSVVSASVSALVLAAAGVCAQQVAAAQAQGCNSDYFRLRNQATCNAIDAANPKTPSTNSGNAFKAKPSNESRSSPFGSGVPTAAVAASRANPVPSLGSGSTGNVAGAASAKGISSTSKTR